MSRLFDDDAGLVLADLVMLVMVGQQEDAARC